MSIPDGGTLTCNVVFRDCVMIIGEREYRADLIQLELENFNVVLGMDWLSKK